MQSNDNSVNIKDEKRPYHHGDLRQALIAIGLALLGEGKNDDLSLREVARRAGVSATAVYRHFPDKQALLSALCTEGSEMLATASRDALTRAGGGLAGFDATGQAYVHFALNHPSLFRLMMSKMASGNFQAFGSADTMGDDPALRELRNNIAAIMPPNSNAEARQLAAIHAWSLVHGMAMLMLEGLIPADEAIISSISRSVLR